MYRCKANTLQTLTICNFDADHQSVSAMCLLCICTWVLFLDVIDTQGLLSEFELFLLEPRLGSFQLQIGFKVYGTCLNQILLTVRFSKLPLGLVHLTLAYLLSQFSNLHLC
jgi:hypothetical protein